MNKKVNLLRVIIFTIFVMSPVLGLFYGHSDSFLARIVDVYLSILFAPVFIFKKFMSENTLLRITYLIFQLLWIFGLATILDKIIKSFYRVLKSDRTI